MMKTYKIQLFLMALIMLQLIFSLHFHGIAAAGCGSSTVPGSTSFSASSPSGFGPIAPGGSATYTCFDGTVETITMPMDACGTVTFQVGSCEVKVRSTVGKWTPGGCTMSGYLFCNKYCDFGDQWLSIVGYVGTCTEEMVENGWQPGIPPCLDSESTICWGNEIIKCYYPCVDSIQYWVCP